MSIRRLTSPLCAVAILALISPPSIAHHAARKIDCALRAALRRTTPTLRVGMSVVHTAEMSGPRAGEVPAEASRGLPVLLH